MEIYRDFDEQKKILDKVADAVYKLIENKLNIIGFSGDDEKNVLDILNKISTSKYFHKAYRDIALNWIYEIAKPARKFKRPLIPFPQEFGRSAFIKKEKETKPITNGAKEGSKEDGENSDGERIFNEGDDDIIAGDEEFPNFDEDDDEIEARLANKKLSNKFKEELLRKLCYYCERSKCTIFCQGFCKRSFHPICKQKVEEGAIGGLDDNKINFELPELKMDDEKLKKMINLTYICNDCQGNTAMCFKCKKKGSYFPELSSSKSKSKAAKAEEIQEKETEAVQSVTSKTEKAKEEETPDSAKMEVESEETNGNKEDGKKANELTKCSTANCNKFYHLPCIANNTLFKYFDANKHKKFRCSLHYCAKCRISGDTMAIAQCVRCPKAYHLKCAPKEKILKLTKKAILCQDHKFDNKLNDEGDAAKKENGEKSSKKNKSKEELKVHTNEDNNNNNNVIKIGKVENNEENHDEVDEVKIPKVKGKSKKPVEKTERKIKEVEKKNEKLISVDFKIGEEIVLSGVMASMSRIKKENLIRVRA